MSDWTPLALVRWTTDYFRKHGLPTPRLDAARSIGFRSPTSRGSGSSGRRPSGSIRKSWFPVPRPSVSSRRSWSSDLGA